MITRRFPATEPGFANDRHTRVSTGSRYEAG